MKIAFGIRADTFCTGSFPKACTCTTIYYVNLITHSVTKTDSHGLLHLYPCLLNETTADNYTCSNIERNISIHLCFVLELSLGVYCCFGLIKIKGLSFNGLVDFLHMQRHGSVAVISYIYLTISRKHFDSQLKWK